MSQSQCRTIGKAGTRTAGMVCLRPEHADTEPHDWAYPPDYSGEGSIGDLLAAFEQIHPMYRELQLLSKRGKNVSGFITLDTVPTDEKASIPIVHLPTGHGSSAALAQFFLTAMHYARRRFGSVSVFLFCALLAAPAVAQIPNHQRAVEACVTKYPAAWACAGLDRPCRADFVILCAREIHGGDSNPHGDKRVGVNYKRGVPAQGISTDILGILHVPGNANHGPDGGTMAVIDVIHGVEETTRKVQWIDASAPAPGWWIHPFLVEPAGGSGLPPPPPPPPPVDLQKVLDAIARLAERIDELEGTVRGLGDSLLPDVDAARVAAEHAADRAGEAKAIIQNARDRLEDIVAATNQVQQQLANPPAYKGRVFGAPITLRPER